MLIFEEGDFRVEDAHPSIGPGLEVTNVFYGPEGTEHHSEALYSEDAKRLHEALGEWLRDRGLA